jgi:hypothetical protein
MAIFGSTINPALGRVDYSPLAQGMSQGGQLAAQGMSNLGAGLAQGINNFLKKKEEKKNEQEAIAFVRSQFPGIDDAAAKAGIKATGGVAAFIKQQQDAVQNDMNQKVQNLQLADLQRTAAERARLDSENKRLREALKGLSPVEGAIAGGAAFGQLPAGADAFTRRPPKNASEFIEVAQNAGIDPSVWLPQAIQLSQVEENIGQAGARRAPIGGFGTAEEALKEAERLGEGRKGFAPSFSVVQGRYFPNFRETDPAQFEDTAKKLKAEAAQKVLDDTKKSFSSQISLQQSAILVQKGIDGGAKTGVFAPFSTLLKRLANDFGISIEGLDQQELLNKGVAGMQAVAIQIMARGLGSMSNADREFFVSSLPSITDSTKVNKFYSELAIENAKFAREDQAFIRKLEREDADVAEINRQLEERRESRNVAESVYERVIGPTAQNNPAAAPSSGSLLGPEAMRFMSQN